MGQQECKIKVKGLVFDETSGLPLSYVNVFIQETADGTTTDEEGNYALSEICPGEYHFIFSHIGCEPIKIHLDIYQDTTLNIGLNHTAISLGNVVVEGKADNYRDQPSLSVNRQHIEDNTNQNLSGLLENESGVHLIKNGNGISKPVVHGLYGNRLTILNNGVVQSGQQWGNDHSPEIDPYSADKITVIKGANAMEYGGGSLGSVILVEPKRIKREPHLHGQVNYSFETNGRGNTLNARLAKYSPILAWKVNGSVKKYGDRKTADYLLNNTGVEEANFSLQLEKAWNEKLFLEFYGSTFNTRLGVLRGSHISNKDDLEFALTRDVPFYTEPDFSYAIDAPKQHVSHHLGKLKAKYFWDNNQSLEMTLAGQLNVRKEFDIRRGGRTKLPALSLKQFSQDVGLKYTKDYDSDWQLKIGIQNNITDNTNIPETNIFPLIPDYLSWKSGIYATMNKSFDRVYLNWGLRYDYENQNVATISRELRKVVRYENQFHNLSGLFAVKYEFTTSQSIGLHTGYAMRNPAINELYSSGLHQGVSGIEEGSIDLKTERALKNTLEYKWLPNANFSFNALIYHQYFKDYIFLNPQDEIRSTIRGAFPVFKYEQTDAHIYGLDISSQFTFSNFLFGQIKYSFIRGKDVNFNRPLIFIPPQQAYIKLVLRANKHIEITDNIHLEESEIELNNRFVFSQNNIEPEQDFAPPPPSYNLLGAKFSTNVNLRQYKFRFYTKADNLLNVAYRDYLNRQRYFADDVGISVTFGLSFKF